MATSDIITEKVYCTGKEGNNDLATALAMNGGGMNSWMNNPFAYIMFMMLFRGFGNGWGDGNGDASRQISQLTDTVNSNNTNQMVLGAINGNREAISQLAQTFNTNTSTIQSAICGVRNAITEVGGQIGMSSQQVINSVLLGNKDLTSAIQSCCCNTQQSILKMGYENQLANKDQTYQINDRLTGIANGVQQGFSSVAYESQRQTCDILNNVNANTQRIVDVLNNHWNADLQQKYNDARLELSQQRQNAYLIEQLKTT